MESGKGQKDRNRPVYKLGERNLEVKEDMEFIDTLLKDLRLEVEPGVRGVILDIAYTLARDKLVEAKRFAKLSNRINIIVDDLKMVHLEETDELKSCVRTLKNMEITQEVLPKPCMEKGLMLPNWRNCQVGVAPELHVPQKKPPPRVVQARPNIVRRMPKGQSAVSASALGKTGGVRTNVVPSTSKVPIAALGKAGGVRTNVVPSTSKGPITVLGKTGGVGTNVVPSTSKGPIAALGKTGEIRTIVVPSTSKVPITALGKAAGVRTIVVPSTSKVPITALGKAGGVRTIVVPSTSKGPITPLGKTEGVRTNVVPSTSKGPITEGVRTNVVPCTSKGPITPLGKAGGVRTNVVPSTSKGPITVVTVPAKASSADSRPSAGSPPLSKKPRLN